MSSTAASLSEQLVAAAKAGDLALATRTISAGAEVNTLDDNLATPLQYACAAGHIEMVRLLLDMGADPNRRGKNMFVGHSPVSIACSQDRLDILQLLHERGGDFSGDAHEDGLSALHTAARAARKSVCAALVGMNMPLNAKDKRGRTPVHWAALNVDTEALEFLIEAGSSIDTADDKGVTPLERAMGAGYIEAVEVLLRSGASIPPHLTGDEFLAAQLVDAGPDEQAVIEKGVRMVRAAVLTRGMDSAFSADEPGTQRPSTPTL